MQNLLIALILITFGGILFLNLYFRIKVLRAYRILVKNRIEFKTDHLFNRKKLIAEVLPQYPKHHADILQFADYIRFSVRIASVLIVLITAFAAALMFLQ